MPYILTKFGEEKNTASSISNHDEVKFLFLLSDHPSCQPCVAASFLRKRRWVVWFCTVTAEEAARNLLTTLVLR